jgi:YD repeat-containing protein
VTFQYDANGNLRSDGGSSYVYDAENRLVSRTIPGVSTVSLAYDPLGRLWQLSAPSGTTRFEYDGDRLLEEFNTAGSWVRLYAWGPGADEPLVWYEGTGGPVRRYLHADHQGSVIAVTDDSANPTRSTATTPGASPTRRTGHLQKLEERRTQPQRLIKEPRLSARDRAVVRDLLIDINNTLEGR